MFIVYGRSVYYHTYIGILLPLPIWLYIIDNVWVKMIIGTCFIIHTYLHNYVILSHSTTPTSAQYLEQKIIGEMNFLILCYIIFGLRELRSTIMNKDNFNNLII